jgi:hypothetical protein
MMSMHIPISTYLVKQATHIILISVTDDITIHSTIIEGMYLAKYTRALNVEE